MCFSASFEKFFLKEQKIFGLFFFMGGGGDFFFMGVFFCERGVAHTRCTLSMVATRTPQYILTREKCVFESKHCIGLMYLSD